jgi:phage terminase large subunit-like protein
VEEEEAPRGECEEWRTWCAVGGWKAGCCCRVARWVDVSAVARVRAGVVARVVVDIAVVALARARDMFALMFAEDVDGGGLE